VAIRCVFHHRKKDFPRAVIEKAIYRRVLQFLWGGNGDFHVYPGSRLDESGD
jgi:hypothetical protein